MAALPESTSVITGHDSFGYFSKAYGVSFLSPAGLTTATEPSAAHMAELIDVIKANNVQALFHESMTSPAIIDQLAEETGRPVAGTLYSGALSPEAKPAPISHDAPQRSRAARRPGRPGSRRRFKARVTTRALIPTQSRTTKEAALSRAASVAFRCGGSGLAARLSASGVSRPCRPSARLYHLDPVAVHVLDEDTSGILPGRRA